MSWDEGLTGATLRIAETRESPLRVMAGPGTGKTYAMKRRVARLLEEDVQPERILAVTFTRVAAADLVEELGSLGIPGCQEITVGTLHSFCFRFLSTQNVFDSLGRVVRPLIYFCKKAVMQYEGAPLLQDLCSSNQAFGNKRDSTKRIRLFEAAWARLQSDTPGWPHNSTDCQFHSELLDWLRFHKAMLIGELVPEALCFLRNNPASPQLGAFDHVIVDEYQDLNRAEQELIDLLSGNCDNSVVGDPDQSIYRFRYAHPAGITDFAQNHPNTHDEPLVECRRCPTRVVDMADYLIRQNHSPGSGRRLMPFPDNRPGDIEIVQWASLQEEVAGLTQYVKSLIENHGYCLGDIIVLSPRRLIGYQIRDNLRSLEIPTHSFYHEEALDAKESQLAFCLLTLLSEPDDRVALRFWLGFESTSWLEGQYRILRGYCEQSGLSPRELLEQILAGTLQLNRTGRLLEQFKILLLKLESLQPLCGPALVEQLFPENVEWAKSLREAASLVVEDDTDASTLLDSLRTSITQPEMPKQGDFVRVMSLHKSKGLTSKVVIVSSCIHGLIPFYDHEQSPVDQLEILQEQRRLFYVAITRCTEILVLSSFVQLERSLAYKVGASLRGRGRLGTTVASNFLAELGPAAPTAKVGNLWIQGGF